MMNQEQELKQLLIDIQECEKKSCALDPSLESRQAWEQQASININRFYEKLDSHPTFQEANQVSQKNIGDLLGHLNKQSISTADSDVIALLNKLQESLETSGLCTAGAGHLGFIPGGGLYIGALADYIAAALNYFSADAFATPSATKIHEDTISWLCELVGYDDFAFGDITSGGSMATVSALAAARVDHDLKASADKNICIYIGEHTHHCLNKALNLLFFGWDINLRIIPSSEQYCLDSQQLHKQISHDVQIGFKPWLVVGTAGSTNLGKIDPLNEMANIAEEFGLWFHVDAAYGGFFKMCDRTGVKFKGIERADSVVLDPHKGLFLPYGCGAVLLKNGNKLRKTFDLSASYLQDRSDTCQVSPMDYSPELTRPFRSLRVWLAIKVHGQNVFENALNEKLMLAQFCNIRLLNMPNIKLLSDIDLSVLAFQVVENKIYNERLTKQLFRGINKHPDVFLSSTLINNQFVIRIAILSFRTHLATIERLLNIIQHELNEIFLVKN